VDSYRAVILEVHAQNNVTSSIYSLSTVYVLFNPADQFSPLVKKMEVLQNTGGNNIFDGIVYTGYYDGGPETQIRITNGLRDRYTFRYLARGIPFGS
jgi:hypothetical protein